MKNIHYYIYMALMAVVMTACSNDDLAGMATSSDEVNGPISFSASAEIPVTRAAGYREWGNSGDPKTMGVFGFYHPKADVTSQMFNNTEVTYNAAYTAVAPWKAATKWRYAEPKFWADYAWCESTDFFAYMPYKEGTTISNSSNSYTVTIPEVTIGSGTPEAPYGFWSGDDTLLICHEPIHKTVVGDVIEYKMDQTLTAFQVQFKLGTTMGALRDFVVKEVKIKGAIAKRGDVSRSYTWDGSEWTAGDIAWNIKESTAEGNEKSIVNGGNLTLTGDAGEEIKPWGDWFYVIPAAFTPTIEVKYDVKLDNEITRKDVVSEIVFGSAAFSGYNGSAAAGKKNPIVINIVPKYLYVLADTDQKQGYLLVE